MYQKKKKKKKTKDDEGIPISDTICIIIYNSGFERIPFAANCEHE